jgi:hydroxymethylglutaryl-CoA reductase
MAFIELDITEMIQLLDKLSPDQQPLWGKMSAQRMVEHLSDIIKTSSGKTNMPLQIEPDKIERMQAFLYSDKPMVKGIEVALAKKEELRHEEIELAIDEFLLEWIDFESHFENNEEKTEIHPFYGELNYEKWCKFHSKHFTHHFKQFGLIE